MAVSKFKIWMLASRPKTLWAAISPVLIGVAIAYADGKTHYLSAILVVFSAVMIQIGTNLANDYYDYKKGADTSERKGPVRVTQAGLIPPHTIKNAFILVFVLAFIAGLYLIYRGGIPILVIGLLSILFGILYTGGPYPLGYNGLGDIFVLIFFGPVAVGGTHYLQTLEYSNLAVIAGIAPGLLSMAILSVNNLRDIDTDRKTGKRTLAVRFGSTFTRLEYLLCLIIAFDIPVFLYFETGKSFYLAFMPVLFIVPLPLIAKVFDKNIEAAALNGVLAQTGKILLLYSVVFSILWNL